LDKDLLKLRLAVIASTAFVVSAFCLSYILWGHDGLPIGSDTPGYVAQSNLVASQGPAAFLAMQGPYDFLYQLFAGFIVWTRIPATDAEIVLPVALAASLPYLMSRLALAHASPRLATLVALSTPAWYAVYRITADLHANLLALTLILAAMIPLSQSTSIKQRQFIIGITLFGLASLAHIESTLFLASVVVVTSLSRMLYPLRVVYGLVGIILPATVLYIVHLQGILTLTGGTLQFSGPMMLSSWLLYLGPLLPLTAIGLFVSLQRRSSGFEALALFWGLASIVVGLSQYVTPQTVSFAQRGVILFPTPFLAAIGVNKLLHFTARMKVDPILFRYLRKSLMIVPLILLISSWPSVYAVAAQQSHRVFLTPLEYQQLVWVHDNLKGTTMPVFMFNDLDQYAGGLAQLYDNWVSAVVGTHFSYLGLTDYLLQGEETPFSEPIARATSSSFMQQILDSGITTRAALLQHQIILIGSFYHPFPLPSYTSNLFTEVSPGILVGRTASMALLSNITVPMYTSFVNHSGAWGGVNADWTLSGEAYEVYHDTGATNVEASFYLGIAQAGTYTIGLRYWDQTGNNLTIALDAMAIGIIEYNNSKTAIVQDFYGITLTLGTHTITITVNQTPYKLQSASLDFLVLTKD